MSIVTKNNRVYTNIKEYIQKTAECNAKIGTYIFPALQR